MPAAISQYVPPRDDKTRKKALIINIAQLYFQRIVYKAKHFRLLKRNFNWRMPYNNLWILAGCSPIEFKSFKTMKYVIAIFIGCYDLLSKTTCA